MPLSSLLLHLSSAAAASLPRRGSLERDRTGANHPWARGLGDPKAATASETAIVTRAGCTRPSPERAFPFGTCAACRAGKPGRPGASDARSSKLAAPPGRAVGACPRLCVLDANSALGYRGSVAGYRPIARRGGSSPRRCLAVSPRSARPATGKLRVAGAADVLRRRACDRSRCSRTVTRARTS